MRLGRSRRASALVAAATVLGGLSSIMALVPAHADYGPSSYDAASGKGDVVCVGSDTVQVIGNFLADGDTIPHAGYNSAGNKYKLVSLDATADANVRIAYSQTSTVSAPINLDPTVYLRAAGFPAKRPNGTGSGYGALLNDVTATATGTATEKINCVRGSALPNQTQQNTAVNNGWVGLHVVRAAFDNLGVAATVSGTTNAPVGLSRQMLAWIYDHSPTTWNAAAAAVTGTYVAPNPAAAAGTTGNCGTCTVVALLPQSGSGTRNTFVADLQAAGCVCTAFAGVNQSVEENDPSALVNSTDPADAIVPFSGDRLALYNSGYFHNPHTNVSNFDSGGNPNYPGGGTLNAGIQMLSGAPTTGAAYNDQRGLYFTYRATDDNAPSWQPGVAANWAQTLFAPGSFLATSFKASGPVNAAAGPGAYSYLDCGSGGPAAWAAAGCVNTVQ